jgi:uncharacterized protein (UPF0264 family)
VTVFDPSCNEDRTVPGLLVSVRSAEEAREAVAGGADIVDVKEPTRGALGRADSCVLASIAADPAIPGDLPLSAALGELSEQNVAETGIGIPARFRFVKVGLAGELDRRHWREKLSRLSRQFEGAQQLVPVAYADASVARAPALDEVFDLARELRASIMLIDTFRKNGACLWDWVSASALARFIGRCHAERIRVVVAGSLSQFSLASCRRPLPDIVAVRGAACVAGDRLAAIDRWRVHRLKRRLEQFSTSPPTFVPLSSRP